MVRFKKLGGFLVLWGLLLNSCKTSPDGVVPIENFDAQRYMGTWYEIARLDHRFERGLEKVTATYTPMDDGYIRVHNKGVRQKDGSSTESIGKAKFAGMPNLGHLKVSFFGPFYASYIVIALDTADYQWSLVSGPSHDYLWILSRQPTMNDTLYQVLTSTAKAYGFETEKLIRVRQSDSNTFP